MNISIPSPKVTHSTSVLINVRYPRVFPRPLCHLKWDSTWRLSNLSFFFFLRSTPEKVLFTWKLFRVIQMEEPKVDFILFLSLSSPVVLRVPQFPPSSTPPILSPLSPKTKLPLSERLGKHTDDWKTFHLHSISIWPLFNFWVSFPFLVLTLSVLSVSE